VDGASDQPAGQADDRGDPAPELETEFRSMLEDKFLDGLIRRFEKLFPDHAAHVEDVLYEEIVRLIEAAGPMPRNVRAVLTWRLRNRMLDVAKRPRPVDGAEPVDSDTPERQAIRKEMFDEVKSLIDRWPNRTMALVVRLTLEAVFYGEVLEVEDIKEIVLEQLGHQLTTANVWTLRSRGLKRLATDVAGLLGESADDWDLPGDENDDGDEPTNGDGERADSDEE
jgi:hypothetical protein